MKSKIVKKGYIFNFHRQEVEINGKIQIRDKIVHNGAVACLLDDGENFIFVKQFRYPLEKEILEIVAGCIEKDEKSTKEAIKRECLEEIGAKVNTLSVLDVIKPSGGFVTEEITIYYSDDFELTSFRNFDYTEEIEIVKINKMESLKMVFNNEFIDGKTNLAILRYFNERN